MVARLGRRCAAGRVRDRLDDGLPRCRGRVLHAVAAHVWGSGVFLAIGAAIIVSVELMRRTVAHFARLSNPNEYSSGIIFSLEAGQAWASWPGQPVPVRLGPEQEVAAMMKDFLGQIATARRLGHWAGAAGA